MTHMIADAAIAQTDLAATLRELVAEVLRLDDGAQLGPEANLTELGLESMSVVELLTRIEIAFDIVVDVDDLSGELFGRFDNLLQFVMSKAHAQG
jgi:acyl carrier protein